MGVVAEWAREDEPAFTAGELRDRQTIEAGSLSVVPIEVEHSDDIDTFGFRISNEGSTLAYSADSGPNGALTAVARDADLFVCEAGSPGEVDRRSATRSPPQSTLIPLVRSAGTSRLMITRSGAANEKR